MHVCHSLDAGLREIPALLRGEAITPESELGSNANSDKPTIPKAIVVGKGFSEDEMDELRKIEGADKVAWLLPDDEKMTWTRIAKAAGTGGAMLPGIIAERARECLKEHGVVPGSDKSVSGQVWGF